MIYRVALLCALVLLSCPFLSSGALADEIAASADLKAATVYSDRAALTRRASVDVPAGKHVVVFKDLPTTLDPDSLRVEGEGSTPVILGALSSKVVHETELVNEREKALSDQLEALEQKRLGLEAEKKVLESKKAFFEGLLTQATRSAQEEISVYQFNTDKWTAAANVVQAGLSDEAKARLELDVQLKALFEERQKIQNELNQIRTGQKSFYEIRLPVEAKSGGRVRLDLSYQLPGAYWRPVYDARLDTASGALALTQYGNVVQRTGEDWSNIALTLSTARPHRGANMPALGPMWVDLWQAVARKAAAFGGAVSNVAMMDAAAPMAMEEEMVGDDEDSLDRWRRLQEQRVAATPQAAVINTGGFTAEYEIPGLSSVPSDGSEAKVYIGAFDTDNSLKVHILPQLGNEAYLVADATLKGEAPVLPGVVSLFRDGAFVGRGSLPLLRAGAEYKLAFGIDDQIEVKHKVLKDESSQSGMFVGKSDVLERWVVSEIQNLRKNKVSIVVDETVPTSKNEKITLELLGKQTTPGYEKDADKIKGLMRWSFDLEPKAKKDIHLGWMLSWPQGSQIQGVQ
ncbi:MAG: mucoidy inhibitor MuiA family protein [Alphaproteobacteria bacterium]|nr:mucoidy inhibitor MuiA family protein [Alphaproteobacteria bacterium]